MMTDSETTIQKLLTALNFDEGRVAAALAALRGESGAGKNVVAEEPLMSSKQLAKRLSISTVTLWRMSPPFIRVWSEVDEFLKANGKRVAA